MLSNTICYYYPHTPNRTPQLATHPHNKPAAPAPTQPPNHPTNHPRLANIWCKRETDNSKRLKYIICYKTHIWTERDLVLNCILNSWLDATQMFHEWQNYVWWIFECFWSRRIWNDKCIHYEVQHWLLQHPSWNLWWHKNEEHHHLWKIYLHHLFAILFNVGLLSINK